MHNTLSDYRLELQKRAAAYDYRYYKTYLLKLALFLIILFIFLFLTLQVHAQTLPSGFSQVQVASGIANPTVMAFAPDGRIFVAQQNGQLRVIKNGSLLSQPFVTLTVNSSGERGLLGIAFDPDFVSNQYIYLYYTISGAANNRISRFTANGDVAITGSEMVLLNLDPLSGATNHNGGTMQFGPDGKLYIGIGENANTTYAQNLDTYHGKVIRINSDGSVPSGNPYSTGSEQRKRLWAYGLRNPFTLTFQPGTGKLFVNDVGQFAWEEIDNATSGGLNFGWPTAEGTSTNPAFTNPVYTYGHGTGSGIGCAITGGAFFNPASGNYPAQYAGRYFFIEYCGNWIDMLTLNGSTWTRSNFATSITGNPVGIITGTDGNLYFLSRSSNAVYKILYTTGTAPVITNQPQSITVAQGNSASFSVTATGTPPLSYQWKKNGTNISGATNSTYSISSVTPSDGGGYSAAVSNSSGSTNSNTATLTVTAPNQSPTATISNPAAGATYGGGDIINFSGSGSDPEDGSLGGAALEWYVMFHHDAHTHPGPSAPSGVSSGSFTIPNSGETSANVFYRLYLVVEDSQGAKDTSYTDILPRTSTITLNTSPQGLMVTLDGQPFTAPLTVTSVEGIIRTIGATSPQTINNALTYNYNSWSQGGLQTQTFATPVSDVTYTANFTAQLRSADTPSNTINGIDYNYYHGSWSVLPNFPSLTPVGTGNVLNFDLTPRTQNDNFGFRFTGYVSVPASGIYTFYTSSDDGSKLYIGTTMVVNNDGLHSNQETSGQIGLSAGKHTVIIDYFELTGQEILTVSYAGPGITKQAIPNSALFRNTTTQTYTLNPVADAFVRSGTFGNTNYGSNTKLYSKTTASNGNNNREIYLRFSISSFSANVSSAKIRLYGKINNTTSPSALVEVHNVIDQTWQENAITYNNKPAFEATVLATKTVAGTTSQYYEWDISQHIINQKNAGATTVSLLLKNTNETSGSYVQFNSKESSTNKSQLVVIGTSPFTQQNDGQKILLENAAENTESNVSSFLKIYPNPAYDYFNAEVSSDFKNSVLKIYDVKGRIVRDIPFSGNSFIKIMTNELKNGMYLVSVENEKGIVRKKLLIEK